MASFPHSVALYRSSPVLNLTLPRWEAAMGSCFHFELAVRLLANPSFPTESVTRDVADGKRGQGLLTLLFGHLTFSEEEKAFLVKCNTLRNKLIHCEPDAVARLAKELNPAFSPPPVAIQVNISDSPRESLVRAVTTGEGAIDIRDTRSRTEGFLGWMLQAAGDGTFDQAVAAFGQGIRILDTKAARV
jgi:hypothetical protein